MGEIFVTVGSSPSASANVVSINFGTAFPTAAFCVFSPGANYSSSLNMELVGVSASSFELYNNGSALTPSTEYGWTYLCNGY